MFTLRLRTFREHVPVNRTDENLVLNGTLFRIRSIYLRLTGVPRLSFFGGSTREGGIDKELFRSVLVGWDRGFSSWWVD